MESIGEKLKSYWLSQGLPFSSGNPESKIAEFESKYKVILPADMRDYFVQVDWSNSCCLDNNAFTFWGLDEVKPLTEERSEDEYENLTDAGNYFIFVDCYLWAWAYAIKITDCQLLENPVIAIGLEKYPFQVAQSFTDFIGLYLAGDSRLYGKIGEGKTDS